MRAGNVVHDRMLRLVFAVSLALIAAAAVGCSSVEGGRLQPSGMNSEFSFQGDRFEEYVSFSRKLIEANRVDLTPANRIEVISGNAPFFLVPPDSCPPGNSHSYGKGILLVHGLTDSPYLMRGLARFFQRECFYVQAILLPGHGTRPGDLLEVTREAWIRAHAFGVRTLKEHADEIYLGGLSTGGTLNLHYAMSDMTVRAIFLFSPAVEITPKARAACWLSALARFIPRLAWLGKIQPDEDPFKYESFAANAACQIFRLTGEVEAARKTATLAVPLFVAASSDDATVDPSAILELYRDSSVEKKQMVLYSRSGEDVPRGVEIVDSRIPERHIASSAHMAMVVPPEDDHYGEKGRYNYCLHYYGRNDAAYARCKDGDEDLLGEISSELLGKGVVRRLTYNPRYDDMLEKMRSFLADLHR